MASRPFRVGRSRTGLGLFATEIIPKGTIIAEYRGRRLRNEEADKLADRGNKYLYEVNSRWTIDGSNRRNLARYGNHSCRPNAESDVTRQSKVIIRAIKKIRPGDEITYDYGEDYFDLIIKPIGCKCDKCREKRAEKRRIARKKRLTKLARAARKAEREKVAQVEAKRAAAAASKKKSSSKTKSKKTGAKKVLSKPPKPVVSRQAVPQAPVLDVSEQRKAA